MVNVVAVPVMALAGLKLHVDSAGSPEVQEKLTLKFTPSRLAGLKLLVAPLPLVAVMAVGFAVRLNAGATTSKSNGAELPGL